MCRAVGSVRGGRYCMFMSLCPGGGARLGGAVCALVEWWWRGEGSAWVCEHSERSVAQYCESRATRETHRAVPRDVPCCVCEWVSAWRPWCCKGWTWSTQRTRRSTLTVPPRSCCLSTTIPPIYQVHTRYIGPTMSANFTGFEFNYITKPYSRKTCYSNI